MYLFKQKESFLRNNMNFRYDKELWIFIPLIHHLTLTEKNPAYMCVKIFNKLPYDIKIISEQNLFREKVKKLLLELEPYSLSDYFFSNFASSSTCVI